MAKALTKNHFENMPTTFPIPIPSLTRVHTLNGMETAIEDFDAFLEEHITLLLLGRFEDSTILLEGANKLCTQETAHPKQRILWVNKLEELFTLKTKIEDALKEGFPEKEITFENVRAIAMMPKVAYVIYVDPSLSPDPKDKRKKISIFQMQRAFNAAIKALPPTPTEEEI